MVMGSDDKVTAVFWQACSPAKVVVAAAAGTFGVGDADDHDIRSIQCPMHPNAPRQPTGAS